MKIAIIGSGISGLTAAHYLHSQHEITVFEANDYIGGHTHTVDVEFEGDVQRVDTGFIVFNDWTYPNFIRLLDELGVDSQPTSMSFSVHCDRTGLEYNGNNLNTLFAQRTNLLRPRFYRMLADIMRFNREAPGLLRTQDDHQTVGEFVRQQRYGSDFVNQYLYPMGSAIWSCPHERFAEFPIRFIAEFYHNHGLLNISHRPIWRVIQQGSRSYVDRLTARFRDAIRLACPVVSVRRSIDTVTVTTASRGDEQFDHVIFACHSDQALRLLADPHPVEEELLSAFPYESNTAILHTDRSILPHRKRAWAAWNYHIPSQPVDRATVTYNMNILQRLRSPHTYCVTLNSENQIDPSRILGRYQYHHPIYTTRRARVQQRHHEILGVRRSSFCGAYWGNGFHEDGVKSALAVCRALGRPIEDLPLPLHPAKGASSC